MTTKEIKEKVESFLNQELSSSDKEKLERDSDQEQVSMFCRFVRTTNDRLLSAEDREIARGSLWEMVHDLSSKRWGPRILELCISKAEETIKNADKVSLIDSVQSHFNLQFGDSAGLAKFQKNILTAHIDHARLSVLLPSKFGASSLLRGIVRWRYENDKNLRVLWISATSPMADLEKVKTGIPNALDRKFIGVFGALEGSRFDLIVMDRPESACQNRHDFAKRFQDWFKIVVLNKLAPGGKIIHIGYNVDRKDFHHSRNMEDSDLGWTCLRFPPESIHNFPWVNLPHKHRNIRRDQFNRLYRLIDVWNDLESGTKENFRHHVKLPEIRIKPGPCPLGYECKADGEPLSALENATIKPILQACTRCGAHAFRQKMFIFDKEQADGTQVQWRQVNDVCLTCGAVQPLEGSYV